MADPKYLRTLSVDDLMNLTLDDLAGMQLGHRNPGDRIVGAFKQLGKYIFADHWAQEQAVALQKIVVGAMNQVQSADAAAYDDLTMATRPFQAGMSKFIDSSLPMIRTTARTACINLLTQAIAVDLGLLPGTDLATIGSELVYAMQENGLTVAHPAENPNGFASYFGTEFGITLPTAATPNVPDSWIDDDLT